MQTTYDIEKPLKARIATLEAENARLTKEREQLWDEKESAKLRARRAAQALIAEIGAPGPESVEETAERAVKELTTLRQSHAKLREAAEAALANMEHYGDNEPRDQKVKAMLRTALQPTPPQGASE
jgi:hypothetical protein